VDADHDFRSGELEMKKLLLFVSFFLLIALPAAAQTTLVTGQVKDTNGVPYAGAQISAQLVFAGTPVSNPTVTTNVLATCRANGFGSAPCQVPFNPSNGPFSLDGGGNIPAGGITVQDNTQVTPSGTQWAFKVNSAGNPPPLGTGPQTCSATITISGASQSVSASFNACPALSNSAGGGVPTVSTLPACASATGTLVSFKAANGVAYGDFYCGGIGPIAQQPANPAQNVSPLSYGALFDLKYVTDAQWGNSSTAITCPNSDCGFTANLDNNKISFGTTGPTTVNGPCAGAACGQVLVPQGTITVVSANAATSSTTSTGACTASASASCSFVWVTQDDTPFIVLAQQAAWNNGTVCKGMDLPSGAAAFSGQILNVTATAPGNPCANNGGNGSQADMIQVGAVVFGQGPGVTTLVPLPNFTFANPVIGGTPQAQYHDFGVNGLGQSLSGTTHAVSLFQALGTSPQCTGSTAFNLVFSGWGQQATSSVGYDFKGGCGDPMTWNVVAEMFGSTTCQLSPTGGQPTVVLGIACFGSNAASLNILLNGILSTYADYFEGNMSGAFAVQVSQGPGTWNSFGDNITPQFATAAQSISLFINTASTVAVHLYGDTVTINGSAPATSSLIQISGTGATLTIQNSTLNATGASIRTFVVNSTNTVNDEGGNTWTMGSAASVFSGLLIADGHSVKGICTGTANASVTNSLYGTGPNIDSTTCAAQTSTLGAGYVVSGSRTLQGLVCTSSATTVSVACTLVVNGSATALTCTMAAAIACNDWVHSVALNDGDLVSERIVTGAAETGANIKMIAMWD
jgi:hypothetical protein